MLPAFVSLRQQLTVYVACKWTVVALLLEIKKMAEKDSTEEVKDLTQCPVCFEPYQEDGDHVPRILPCHCTLCEGCIGKLLKNNALECPQDRQKHKAERGVKSFSQNKYIVAYLKREIKENVVEYDECSAHGLKIVLYCKNKGCEIAVCPICMSEKHLTHQVVNILEEQKCKLTDKIDGLKGKLKFYHDQVLAAKQHAEHEFDTKIKLLKGGKKEQLKELDEKLADAIENLATLNDIEMKVKQDTTQTDIANKMEFVDIVDGLTKQSQEPIAYKCFDLVEKKALHDSFSVLPLNESEETRINKYVTKGMLYFLLVPIGPAEERPRKALKL